MIRGSRRITVPGCMYRRIIVEIDALCLGDPYETDDEDKVATFETGRSLGINRKGCL